MYLMNDPTPKSEVSKMTFRYHIAGACPGGGEGPAPPPPPPQKLKNKKKRSSEQILSYFIYILLLF